MSTGTTAAATGGTGPTGAAPMLVKVLKLALQHGATDIHAKAGDVFRARVNGELVPLSKQRLTPRQTRDLAATLCGFELDSPDLAGIRDFDCSWGAAGVGRFRVNVLRQRSSFMVVLRVIPFSVPSPEDVGIPQPVLNLVAAPAGLILLSGQGAVGQGRTLAALVHQINRNQERHVVTLENPIEYLHRDLKSLITQREAGSDTDSVTRGIQAALRQDADVIVVDEVHDAQVVEGILRAIESGKLVIAAVSAPDCATALIKFPSPLPAEEREVARMRLAANLGGVVAQRMQVRHGGRERSFEFEWLRATGGLRQAVEAGVDLPAMRKAIRELAENGDAELFQA